MAKDRGSKEVKKPKKEKPKKTAYTPPSDTSRPGDKK